MGINGCQICLDKQRRIDSLEDEVKRLKQALGRRERKDKDGFFGSSTPSSKKPVKPNSDTVAGGHDFLTFSDSL